MPNLQEYFARINYTGSTDPTLETLTAVHRAHGLSIPYENIDVYLGRPVDQDITRIFDKMVTNRRGGWCYEMNGLLGWALNEIGFDVTRLCGGVMRELYGEDTMGGHLVLQINLDEPWIADLGVGDGPIEPYALKEGPVAQAGRTYRLEQLEDKAWRLHNREGSMPPSLDFFEDGDDEDRLADVGVFLQTSDHSIFRQNLICQQITEHGALSLLGRTFKDTAHDPQGRTLDSEDELIGVLTDDFSINLPDVTGLWDKVCARHEELFGDNK